MGEVPNCSEIGVLGVLPGMIGVMQATEAIKIVLGLGDVLSGKLLYYNTLKHQQRVVKFDRKASEVEKVIKKW